MLLKKGKLEPDQLRPCFSLSSSLASSSEERDDTARVYANACHAADRFFRSEARLALACGYPGIDWIAELSSLFRSLKVAPCCQPATRLAQVALANEPGWPLALVRLHDGATAEALAEALNEPATGGVTTADWSAFMRLTPHVDALQTLLKLPPGYHAAQFVVRELVVTPLTGAQMPWFVSDSQARYLNLFGGVTQQDGLLTMIPGYLYSGPDLLVLPATALLADAQLARAVLETAASNQLTIQQELGGDTQRAVCRVIPQRCDTRFIITGERYDIALLQETYGTLANPQLPYLVFEPILNVAENEALLSRYLLELCRRQGIPHVDDDALSGLGYELARLAESQHQVLLDGLYLNELLTAVKPMITDAEPLTATLLRDYRLRRERELSGLKELTLDSIQRQLLYIETAGLRPGQVNGLSVVSVAGHPGEFGEPVRITASTHYGDGEFSDIERKSELGGNLHAKGMMLVQSFLQHQFGYHHPLPVSYNLAFEQSYQETDGDSASLAALCAILSAIIDQPLRQSLAVTGAVDHFGRVLAVGGINEKIEGFFDLCRRRGLDGSHGVILPQSNIQQLVLAPDVVQAVENGSFLLYGVTEAWEALTLLCADITSDQLIEKIHRQLRSLSLEHPEESRWNLFKRLAGIFRSG